MKQKLTTTDLIDKVRFPASFDAGIIEAGLPVPEFVRMLAFPASFDAGIIEAVKYRRRSEAEIPNFPASFDAGIIEATR